MTLGWRVHHVMNSTRLVRRRDGQTVRVSNILGHAGVPDLVMTRAGRLVFAELKRDRGSRGGGVHEHVEPTPEQQAWMADLVAASAEVYLWRPVDMDRIAAVLGRG